MFDVIRARLGQTVPFADTVGVEILEVASGEARAALVQRDDISNHVQSLHAGALFTLAEAASGAAMAGAFAQHILSIRPLAAGAQIAYKKIAKGRVEALAKTRDPAGDLVARLEADGKAAFAVDVVMINEAEETVATMTVDWHVSKRA